MLLRSKIIFGITVTLLFTVFSFAQEVANEPVDSKADNPKTTIKIDEFGRLGDCDASARVDNLFIQLNNNPDAKGYVITYAGDDLLPSQRNAPPILAQIRKAIAFRSFDVDRIVFINGGFRENQGGEFYLVPFGAIPPEPSETVPAPKSPTGTFLWSRSMITNEMEFAPVMEFVRPEVKAKIDEEERLSELEYALEKNEDDNQEADSRSAEINVEEPFVEEPLTPQELQERRFSWANEKFGDEIAKRKGAHGVLIFYADDEYYDIAKIRRFVEEGLSIIAAAAKIRSEQIKIVFGGYRDTPDAEYYVVPKNGKAPQAKPDERPTPEPAEESEN